MNFSAQISLKPSFRDSHVWRVEVDETSAFVTGEYSDLSARWELSKEELEELPDVIRSGRFPNDDYERFGLDGIEVDFNLRTPHANIAKTIWCPEYDICPEYVILLRWCWDGLYGKAGVEYRWSLRDLGPYFYDWNSRCQVSTGG